MAKTITFTDEELKVLEEYLFCNPCSGGCVCEVPNKVDCFDLKANGEYKCPFMQITHSIEEKLGI